MSIRTTQEKLGGGGSIGSVVSGGTEGSVLFLGASGVLAQDNANLFFDDTNNRLGIGTNSPSARLEVNSGSTAEVARFTSSGVPSGDTSIGMYNDSTLKARLRTNQNGILVFYVAGAENHIFDHLGNVGFGTLGPTAKVSIVNSLTGSSATSSLDFTTTWNTSGTPTLIKASLTDTASNAASLLMDLQVGATSRFKIAKTGAFTMTGAGGGNITATQYGQLYGTVVSGNTTQWSLVAIEGSFLSGLGLASTSKVYWNSGDAISATPDLYLSRAAAAKLRLGNADAASPVAQTLSVQNVVAGTSNTAGANFTIAGSQGTGTGAGGSVIIQTAAAGGSGSSQNALADNVTIASTGKMTLNLAAFNTLGLQVGSTGVGLGNFGSNALALYGNSVIAALVGYGGGFSGIRITSDGYFGWSDTTAISSGQDLYLYRDAADTLAQRRSTNAQTFRIYKTYTDSSNYERLNIYGLAPYGMILQTEKGGTGTNQPLTFGAAGTVHWQITTSGHYIALTDNVYDFGTSGANRARTGYFGTSVVLPLIVSSGNANTNISFGSDHIDFKQNSSAAKVRFVNGGGIAQLNNQYLGWNSTTDFGTGTIDVTLYRDAADTLALRRSTNAQTMRIYNTYTDGSNYERVGIGYSSNTITFASEAAGTGTVRNFSFTGGNISIADGKNIILDTTTGTKIGTSTSQKLGFFNATPVVRPAAYTPSNVTTDRTYDANATTIDELADVLGTLIGDIQSLGLIG